jgi:hypothetical protein
MMFSRRAVLAATGSAAVLTLPSRVLGRDPSDEFLASLEALRVPENYDSTGAFSLEAKEYFGEFLGVAPLDIDKSQTQISDRASAALAATAATVFDVRMRGVDSAATAATVATTAATAVEHRPHQPPR